MAYSFYFGDTDSIDIGLKVDGTPDLGTAQRDGELISIPGKDGDDYIDYGRYKNVEFSLDVALIQKGSKTVRAQIDDVIDAFAYLHGYQYFEDSDHHNLETEAVLTNFGDFKRELRRLGRATLQFSRKPFWYDVESMNRYIGVPLIDEIPTREFQNPFKLIAKPIIEFQTTAGSIGSFQYSITDDDGVETEYSAYLDSSAATTVIDCEKEAATINGNPVDLTIPKGLMPGTNTFKLLSRKDRLTSIRILPRWRRL